MKNFNEKCLFDAYCTTNEVKCKLLVTTTRILGIAESESFEIPIKQFMYAKNDGDTVTIVGTRNRQYTVKFSPEDMERFKDSIMALNDIENGKEV